MEGSQRHGLRAPKVRGEMKRFYDRKGDEPWEGVSYALLAAFDRTIDAERAAPLLAQLIAEHDVWDDRSHVVATLIDCLQAYAGPLRVDLSEKADVAELKRDRQEALDWWQKNKTEKPVYWALDALSPRLRDRGPNRCANHGRRARLGTREGRPGQPVSSEQGHGVCPARRRRSTFLHPGDPLPQSPRPPIFLSGY